MIAPWPQPIATELACDAPDRSTRQQRRVLTLAVRLVDEVNKTVACQRAVLSAEMRAENGVEVDKLELEQHLSIGAGFVGGHEKGPVASDSTQRLHSRNGSRRRSNCWMNEFVVVIERRGRP